MITAIATAIIVNSLTESQTVPPTPLHFTSGTYRLIWDDAINQELEGNKNCDISIRISNTIIEGVFSRLSGNRKASLKGRVDELRSTSVLSFRQIEENYICIYQLVARPQPIISMAGQDAPPVYLGIWQDTEGRSGDFALFKYQ